MKFGVGDEFCEPEFRRNADPNLILLEIPSLITPINILYRKHFLPNRTSALTTGADILSGSASNDTFFAATQAGNGTWTAGDKIDGGAGADTLTIAQGIEFSGAPAGTTVANIETVNIASGGKVSLNTITSTAGFTGLTNLNVNSVAGATITTGPAVAVKVADSELVAGAVTVNGGNGVTISANGGTTGAITVGGAIAAKGAIAVTYTQSVAASGTGGAIAVTGGSTVNVTSTTSGNAVNTTATLGAITVTGTSETTSVSVTQSAAATGAAATLASANANNAIAAVVGIADSVVTINDANAGSTTAQGTISSVTLQNYANSTISSSGLTSLTLSATGATGTAAGTLDLTSGLTTGNPTTLALNLGGGSLGAITDKSNKFKTVNANLTANTTLGGITDSALTTLNVAGSGVLTLSAVNTALTSVAVSGSAGLKADLSGATNLNNLAFTNSGTNTVTLNSQNQAYSGGSGSDIVTISADTTKAISGGAGVNTLVLNAAASTFTAANTVKNVTGFTTLGTNSGSSGNYDLSVLTGFNAINVLADVAGATTFSKVAAGTSLTLNAATTSGITFQTSDTAGSTDLTNVTLKGATATGGGTKGYTVNALTIQDANGVGHGTVNFATDSSVGGGAFTVSTLTDSALNTLNISGTGSLTITNAATTSTQLAISDNDTSTATSAISTLTSTGDVLGNLTYSGTHAFTVGTLTDKVANLTISNANTGTSGVLTISAHSDDSLVNLTLNGSVAYTGISNNSVATTVSGATDNSNVSLLFNGSGIKSVTLGNGNDSVTTGGGADVITLGTGADTVTGGAGADKITFGAHTGVDTIKLAAGKGATGGDSGVFSVPNANTISTANFDIVTGMKLGDKVQIGAVSFAADGASANTLVGLGVADNKVALVRGAYDATGKNFVGSATGADTLFVYDSDGITSTAYEAVVLVGYVANSVTGIGSSTGLVTLG